MTFVTARPIAEAAGGHRSRPQYNDDHGLRGKDA